MKTFDAIRVVMAIPDVIVMVGIDHRIAFRAVEVSYSKVGNAKEEVGGEDVNNGKNKSDRRVRARSAREIARDYLGKIIQLPVRLLPADERGIDRLVDEYLFADAVADTPKKKDDKGEQGEVVGSTGGIEVGIGGSVMGESHGVETATEGRARVIGEILKDSISERDLYRELARRFGFSNPRQLLRLRNSYRLLKVLGRAREFSHKQLMTMLFWQEFLHKWGEEARTEIERITYEEHMGKVNLSVRDAEIVDREKIGIRLLFTEKGKYDVAADFVRMVVLPHGE